MKTKSKNKKLRIALGICIPLIIIIAAALAVVMKYGPTFGFYLVPPSAERYGKDALATIGKSGIYSGSDEWKSTYEECLKMIENAESYEDTYPAIKKALSVCGGKHSMLMTKSESQDILNLVFADEIDSAGNSMIYKLDRNSLCHRHELHFLRVSAALQRGFGYLVANLFQVVLKEPQTRISN